MYRYQQMVKHHWFLIGLVAMGVTTLYVYIDTYVLILEGIGAL